MDAFQIQPKEGFSFQILKLSLPGPATSGAVAELAWPHSPLRSAVVTSPNGASPQSKHCDPPIQSHSRTSQHVPPEYAGYLSRVKLVIFALLSESWRLRSSPMPLKPFSWQCWRITWRSQLHFHSHRLGHLPITIEYLKTEPCTLHAVHHHRLLHCRGGHSSCWTSKGCWVRIWLGLAHLFLHLCHGKADVPAVLLVTAAHQSKRKTSRSTQCQWLTMSMASADPWKKYWRASIAPFKLNYSRLQWPKMQPIASVAAIKTLPRDL